MNARLYIIIAAVVYSICLFFQSYFLEQNDFFANFGLFTLMFSAFIVIYKYSSQVEFKQLAYLGVFLHVISILALPNLSPDFYRFLWDGELITQGINPYFSKPPEYLDSTWFQNSPYIQELYSGITELSKDHYTCYPSVNQVYFYLSTVFTDNVLVNVVLMRLLMFATMLLGFKYAMKMLKQLHLIQNRIWLFAMNPFVIIELTTNLHYEGVMMSFLIIGLYYVLNHKLILGALFWAMAINVKLTPLLMIPFVFKYLKWKKATVLYVVGGLFTAGLLFTFLWPSAFENFKTSLELYSSNFEFNASFYYIWREIDYWRLGWNNIKVIGPIITKIGLIVIAALAFIPKMNTKEAVFKWMMLGAVAYLLFATTVHPWYVAMPLALSIFVKNSYSIVAWSFLAMLSYGLYAELPNWSQTLFLWIEYAVVLIWLIVEWRRRCLSESI